MNAAGAVIYRKLHAGKQKNPLILRGCSQGFELAKVEFIMVGNNSDSDTGDL
ncbi:MAG: hypothetical protein LBK56_11550 [Gracilibacteraceae bacterium]|nr:hypothetical protein [Gracilibacteraceae bacterium]